jgi:hypothetical protein
MEVVAPSKKNEKNPPLLSTMFIIRFEGNCGTFGKERKTPLLSMTLCHFAPPKKKPLFLFLFFKNDHGVDVSMIIVI